MWLAQPHSSPTSSPCGDYSLDGAYLWTLSGTKAHDQEPSIHWSNTRFHEIEPLLTYHLLELRHLQANLEHVPFQDYHDRITLPPHRQPRI